MVVSPHNLRIKKEVQKRLNSLLSDWVKGNIKTIDFKGKLMILKKALNSDLDR